MPKVTVAIPAYNAEKYILECIQSVLHQTFQDFELIVVDDCSTDTTAEKIRSVKDSRLIYHRNDKNLGPPQNFNRCVELAKGEYITIFHADDIMEPENLEQKVKFLDAHPDVGFVHSCAVHINQNNIASIEWSVPGQRRNGVYHDNFFERLLVEGNLICAPSVMARKKCYLKAGPFETRLQHACDWEMWLRLSFYFGAGYLETPLVRYRLHTQMHSARYAKKLDFEREYRNTKIIILKKLSKKMPHIDAVKKQADKDILKRLRIFFRLSLLQKKCGTSFFAGLLLIRHCILKMRAL